MKTKRGATSRVAHGFFREIAANREIGCLKLVQHETIWPRFEGLKVKDQGENRPSIFDGR